MLETRSINEKQNCLLKVGYMKLLFDLNTTNEPHIYKIHINNFPELMLAGCQIMWVLVQSNLMKKLYCCSKSAIVSPWTILDRYRVRVQILRKISFKFNLILQQFLQQFGFLFYFFMLSFGVISLRLTLKSVDILIISFLILKIIQYFSFLVAANEGTFDFGLILPTTLICFNTAIFPLKKKHRSY